ncbi:hypothetical protein PSACC_01977 [Paramicrosporidium saccamoebae]|uniref:RPAP1 N-terminal domain-containing protein n=1 Tax=Paramicrosporidium saccamoebae TaxID=1246581 RepID=A0A2H9TKF1_9FUNG|nr:hypothetical protein PSACC_01977 [Paramicrosporidium saccamoebae]
MGLLYWNPWSVIVISVNLMDGCHPGVPPYEEPEEAVQRSIENPAARTGSSKPVMGTIVERTVSPGSIRPPGPRVTHPPRDPLKDEISRENDKIIMGMTSEEILEEQEALKRTLSEKLVKKWSQPK